MQFLMINVNFIFFRNVHLVRNKKYLLLHPPLTNKGYQDDSVAQLVEHIPFKDGVLGPNPSWVTKHMKSQLTFNQLRFFLFARGNFQQTFEP